jgi:Tfp pilus assembly protein PilX
MHLNTVSRNRQTGSTLVVSMMVLILILMMGIAAMVTSDTQFKLSGNLQFGDVALNNAESAIAQAEQELNKPLFCLSAGFDSYSAATPHVYPISATLSPLTMAWSDGNTMQAADDTQRYTIQLISKNVSLNTSGLGVGGRSSAPSNRVNTYLITARGTSARGSVKYVQSYYRVNLPCK